jgi:hypothetical protein
VPPTHSSRPIVSRDGIGLLAPRRAWRGFHTSLSGLAPRSGERACKVVGRCRYRHLPGRGSWSALAPWPADRFANQVPERQAAPCRSIPPTWPKASAPWAAWTLSGAWPRRHTQGRADPSPTRTWVNSCQSGSSLMFRMAAGSRWLNATATAPGPGAPARPRPPGRLVRRAGPAQLPLGVDQHQPGPISREQLLGRVGDLLQGWSWTVG